MVLLSTCTLLALGLLVSGNADSNSNQQPDRMPEDSPVTTATDAPSAMTSDVETETDKEDFYPNQGYDYDYEPPVVNSSNSNESYSNQSTCMKCQLREEEKKWRIQMIKYDILRKLNFVSPPNITNKTLPKVPSLDHLMESYGMQGDNPFTPPSDADLDYEEESTSGRVERMYINSKSPPAELDINATDSFYMELPEAALYSRVQKAKLWIYVKQLQIEDLVLRMDFFLVRQPLQGEEGHKRNLVGYKKIFPDHTERWHHFDIKNVVQKWSKQSVIHKYILMITVRSEDDHNPVVTPLDQDYRGYEPTLELKLQEKHKRHKRNVPLVCSESSKESRCCRYALTVSFIDFGWDWVIAPAYYEANYCHGDCRFTHQEDSTNAVLVSQTSLNGLGGPCCTPTLYSPISLLYFDRDEMIVFTNLPKMRVDRCGCA